MRRKLLAVALVAGILTPAGQAAPAFADPPGTVSLTQQVVPSTVQVRAASTAGIAYETDGRLGGHSQWWLKGDGPDPVPMSWRPSYSRYAMEGRMLFEYTGQKVLYSNWNGPMHSCPVYPYGGVKFIPTGWAWHDKDDYSVKLIEATESGCTTRTLLTQTADRLPLKVFGGDANGLVVESRIANKEVLAYHRFSDPDHPVTLDAPTTAGLWDIEYGEQVRGGAVLVMSGGSIWRVPLDGSPATGFPDNDWLAITATGAARITGAGLQTAPLDGGPIQTKAGVTGAVVSDGMHLYTNQATGETPGVYERGTATGSATRVVARPSTVYPSEQVAIALSPGRVYYTNRVNAGDSSYEVETRSLTTGPGTVSVGAEQPIGTATWAALSASAGRLVYDGTKHRTYTGQTTTVPTQAASPPEMSGNRWLIRWEYAYGPEYFSGRQMWDVRTGQATARSWPQGAQDLFGNYLLYARADGAVRLRNLLKGTETQPRAAGGSIGAVALHSKWAAWVTGCPTGELCAQTLSVRDLGTGSTRTLAVRGVTSLDLSGGYLAFDTVLTTTRALRVLGLNDGKVTVISNLPEAGTGFAVGSGFTENFSPPRHFDLEDEVIGWLDPHRAAKVAHVAPFIDAPRSLGDAIAPASFHTTWGLAAPVSKALPSCTVTFYRGTTKVRILNCANTNGMVSASWDGRTGSGAALPAGKYTYRISGKDSDGYWLRNYDGSLTTVGGTITKT